MRQAILELYQIEFVTKELDTHTFKKRIRKVFRSNSQELSLFMNTIDSSANLREWILPDIEAGLSNPDVKYENGSETVFIIITDHKVLLHDSDDNLKCTVDLPHFKEIILMWIEFLEEGSVNEIVYNSNTEKNWLQSNIFLVDGFGAIITALLLFFLLSRFTSSGLYCYRICRLFVALALFSQKIKS